jgi:alpha-methylacyl-CoA racemase
MPGGRYDPPGMGPLEGVKVVELAGIGPAPFCSMLLADMGADVLRVDRVEPTDLGVPVEARFNFLIRGRRSVALDLKNPAGVAAVKRLVERADVLVEGFRPGVTERLGLGPDDCLALNPRLVYGRVTGWGQSGPLAQAAGHDINYIALSGALASIGPRGGPPVPPLNLLGDFGGGALYLAFGVVCALWEARQSGRGQVVDAAMVDGAASLMTAAYGLAASGRWVSDRGSNILDGGAPWYGVYRTADDQYVAIGAIEERFYLELLRKLGLDPADLPPRGDRASWPLLRARLGETFAQRTRAEWSAVLEGSEVCFAPVLALDEAPEHPHNQARGTFVSVDGVRQPGPAPRFSRTRAEVRSGPAVPGAHMVDALRDWGFSDAEVTALQATGATSRPVA